MNLKLMGAYLPRITTTSLAKNVGHVNITITIKALRAKRPGPKLESSKSRSDPKLEALSRPLRLRLVCGSQTLKSKLLISKLIACVSFIKKICG
jgi:hypothetical protein